MTAEASATTTVGSVLNGTYLLERVIAEGGMGMVYEAQHLRLPRKFAVKVLGKPKDAHLVATALARFRREAEIAATLSHPHIVEVVDFQVSEGGSPYLVMELLEGEDLAERLQRGRIAAVAVVRLVEEMAAALDVAHGKGVVHRDLKPANVFLARMGGRDDFVKVLDFGVSKLIDAATLTQEKAMVGTPLYMSPEQAVGTQELTPESDIFSLGSIAFEMLTGRRAFAASSIPSILYQIVHGPTPRPSRRAPGLGPEVDEVFEKVLAKKKHQRYGRASEFAAALRRAVERPAPVPEGWSPVGEPSADLLNLGVVGESTGGAGPVTEIDQSTRAEEAMAGLAEAGSIATDDLRIKPRRGPLLWAVAGAAALGVASLVVALVAGGGGDPPPPVAAPAPVAPPVAPPPVMVTPASLELPPDPVTPPPREAPPAEVQFVFHVRPQSAKVTVDDRPVRGTQVTLPRGKQLRRVRITAPGYRPISLEVPGTQSRTFEMHMERLPPARPARPAAAAPARAVEPAPAPRPERPHGRLPVQDL